MTRILFLVFLLTFVKSDNPEESESCLESNNCKSPSVQSNISTRRFPNYSRVYVVNAFDDQLNPEDFSYCEEDNCKKPLPVQSGIINTTLRWIDNTVAFQFDIGYPYGQVIYDAVNHIKGRTCMRFNLRTTETDYIHVKVGEPCCTDVGRKGGEQYLCLGPQSRPVGAAIHELVHTIGFYHEHQRPDRGQFVTINWNHVLPGKEGNFVLLNDSFVSTFDVPYDYGSIMHYQPDMNAKTNTKAFTPMDHDASYGGLTLSSSDIQKINRMYCPGTIGIRILNKDGKAMQAGNVTGSPIVTSDWTGADGQKWTTNWGVLKSEEPTSLVSWNQTTGLGVLTMTASATLPNVTVTKEDANSVYQKWSLQRVDFEPQTRWKLINFVTRKCLSSNGNSEVQQLECAVGDDKQKWTVYIV